MFLFYFFINNSSHITYIKKKVLGFRVLGVGFMVQDLRILGLGFKVLG